MRRVTTQSHPLLKLTIPLALLAFAVGITLFLTATATCTPDIAAGQGCTAGSTYTPRDPMVLLPWLLGGAAAAFAGLLYRKKEELTYVFPTDTLHGKPRPELQKVLDGLEEGRRKGEIPEERYRKARDRVLKEMK